MLDEKVEPNCPIGHGIDLIDPEFKVRSDALDLNLAENKLRELGFPYGVEGKFYLGFVNALYTLKKTKAEAVELGIQAAEKVEEAIENKRVS